MDNLVNHMLYFYPTDADSIDKIKEEGCLTEVRLRSVADLDYNSSEPILVVNPVELGIESNAWYGQDTLHVEHIPLSAIKNIDPYKQPRLVIAGGGFLMRQLDSEMEIALIYRKGKWDIPKGKLDSGESFQECAVREVQEELGIQHILCEQPLGSTWHCYERKGKFCVKRTYWYEMKTTDIHFHPQAEEDIEDVVWHSWSAAKEIIDYPIFRMHMDYVEPLLMK